MTHEQRQEIALINIGYALAGLLAVKAESSIMSKTYDTMSRDINHALCLVMKDLNDELAKEKQQPNAEENMDTTAPDKRD